MRTLGPLCSFGFGGLWASFRNFYNGEPAGKENGSDMETRVCAWVVLEHIGEWKGRWKLLFRVFRFRGLRALGVWIGLGLQWSGFFELA